MKPFARNRLCKTNESSNWCMDFVYNLKVWIIRLFSHQIYIMSLSLIYDFIIFRNDGIAPAARMYDPTSLSVFDQSTYTASNPNAGWADVGLLYTPKSCGSGGSAGACTLHVILHDCGTREEPWLPPSTTMSTSASFVVCSCNNPISSSNFLYIESESGSRERIALSVNHSTH